MSTENAKETRQGSYDKCASGCQVYHKCFGIIDSELKCDWLANRILSILPLLRFDSYHGWVRIFFYKMEL